MDFVDFIRDVWHHLTQPELLRQWVESLGLWLYVILFVVIFCETGLVVTPFLPGDSLLFAVGVVTVTSSLSLPHILILLISAAVLGDAVNYLLGYYIGPAAFRSQRSWLLHPKHLLRAQEFYHTYGGKAIILARFVPIVRTFAPFVAGIGKMQYRRFAAYNVIGGVAWVLICIFAGRLFAGVAWVQDHFEMVMVAIVVISVMPMVVELTRAWLRRRREPAASSPAVHEPSTNGTAKQEEAVKAPAGESQ